MQRLSWLLSKTYCIFSSPYLASVKMLDFLPFLLFSLISRAMTYSQLHFQFHLQRWKWWPQS